MKKWIFIVIGILIVGFAGYYFFSASKSNKNQQSAFLQNRTATVQQGNFQVSVSGTGTVEPVTDQDISSPITDNAIAEVLVSSGETVKSGEDLITFTDGSNPITAPADGTITSISVAAGERVQAGQVVAHLTDFNNLKTTVQIDELDIPKVQVGQSATIKVNAFPNQSFTGKVTGIANEGTNTNGVATFNVDCSINNPQSLKVGMSTEADILTASKDNAIYVPLEAVHSMGSEKFVILASGNSNQNQGQNQGKNQGQSQGQNWSSSRVMVTTGLANTDYVEITSGLKAGQVVRLPNLAISSTTSTSGNSRGMFGSFGGMGGGGRSFGGGGYGGGRSFGGGARSGGGSGN